MSLPVPSAEEVEARLADLRRRREALDRAIADHLLYLDLGRRLRGETAPPAPAVPGERANPGMDGTVGASGTGRAAGTAPARGDPAGPGSVPLAPPPDEGAPVGPAPRSARSRPRGAVPGRLPPAPAPATFAADPTGARRYGRALVEAALATLAAAGRPMHAAEILEHLAARGFVLPGRDPVAALNTRLWKRAAPGGPLRRLGEAVYALSEARAPG